MTVPNTSTSNSYAGTGSQTAFPFTFRVPKLTDLRVVVTGIDGTMYDLVAGVGYTATGIGLPSGGTVTTTAAPVVGETLTVMRVVSLTQELDLRNQGPYFAEDVEAALDRVTMATQQLQEAVNRAIKIPLTASGLSPDLPAPRAGFILGSTAGESYENIRLADAGQAVAGNWSVDRFVATTDFTPDVSTTLTLSRTPASAESILVLFDGAVKHRLTYSVAGTTLTLSAPIPSGVSAVEVRITTTLAIGETPDGANASTYTVLASGSSVARPLRLRFADEANALDFGADPTGVADSTAAINAALAANLCVFLPAGTYKTLTAINITRNGQVIRGAGRDTTVIRVSASSVKGIAIAAGVTNAGVYDLTVSRSGGSTSTGIEVGAMADGITLWGLRVTGHQIGVTLYDTNSSVFGFSIVEKNTSSGVLQDCVSGVKLGWSLTSVSSNQNALYGFFVRSTSSPNAIDAGSFTDCSTYANTGGGFFASGAAGKEIKRVRITGGAFAYDGTTGIGASAYASAQIVGASVIGCGTVATGPTLVTAANHSSKGIVVGSPTAAILSGCRVEGVSREGIYAGSNVTISGCVVLDCGVWGSASTACGIRIQGTGPVTVVGCYSGNMSGATQTYGIYASGDSMVCAGNYLVANATAPFLCDTAMPTSLVDLQAGSRIRASATYDPPSLTTGSGTTTTVTATGATLGSIAMASFSLDTQGIKMHAWVSAADTVSVRFENATGGTIDLASGTLRVVVIKS